MAKLKIKNNIIIFFVVFEISGALVKRPINMVLFIIKSSFKIYKIITHLFLFFQQNTFFLQYTLFCSHLFHKTLNNQILFTNKFIIHQFTKKKIFFLFKIRIISKNFTNCNLYFFQAIHIFINICNFKFR